MKRILQDGAGKSRGTVEDNRVDEFLNTVTQVSKAFGFSLEFQCDDKETGDGHFVVVPFNIDSAKWLNGASIEKSDMPCLRCQRLAYECSCP